MKKRISILIMISILTGLLPLTLTGCAGSRWKGTWNRIEDATYSRGSCDIVEVSGKDITFAITVYSGNVAGRLNGRAAFVDREKTQARWYTPDQASYLDFSLDEDGWLDIMFRNVLSAQDEYTVVSTGDAYSGPGGTEESALGLAPGGFVTGRFTKGSVEYLNTSLAQMGIISEEYDAMLRDLVSPGIYMRFLDCFQKVSVDIEVEVENKAEGGKIEYKIIRTYMPYHDEIQDKIKHDDEIGGYVYYGGNAMQELAAVIICYDDMTIGAAVSREESVKPLYFTNNGVYTSAATIIPAPIENWIEEYKIYLAKNK